MAKVLTFNLEPQDIDIIERHNQELASPGRSAALRHILREWATNQPVRVPIIGKIEDDRVVWGDDTGRE